MMNDALYRPIRSLSAYAAPPGDRLVAVLKAFLDDSGDADMASEKYLTIAGWLGDEDGWSYFEPHWAKILAGFGVPYLHMKEFGDTKSRIYGHLKSNPAKEREFMEAIIGLIKGCARGSVATTVILGDLRTFNDCYRLQLDPYALAIYGCLFQLRSYHPNDEIDLIFDKFDNSISRVGKAFQYARSDAANDLKLDLFSPLPLQKNESWRNVLPLQAADIIAWEVRKYRRERAAMSPPSEVRGDREAMLRWAQAWEEENAPRDRGSFKELRRGTIFRPLHIVIDTHALEESHSHHLNGWGE